MGAHFCGILLALVCGSTTEVMQLSRNILKLLAAVIHKNRRNAVGNSQNAMPPALGK